MIHHTETEPCLMGSVNEMVSMSSPEEENLWEDLNIRMFFQSTDAASALFEVAFFSLWLCFLFRRISMP